MDIMQDINIRISNEEMKRLKQSSLKLADGSGQLGTLGVYHELHCLVQGYRRYMKGLC